VWTLNPRTDLKHCCSLCCAAWLFQSRAGIKGMTGWCTAQAAASCHQQGGAEGSVWQQSGQQVVAVAVHTMQP
jgi:hypothetical protein